jgi:hypothetical protein
MFVKYSAIRTMVSIAMLSPIVLGLTWSTGAQGRPGRTEGDPRGAARSATPARAGNADQGIASAGTFGVINRPREESPET